MSPACKNKLSGAAKVGAVVLVVSLGLWGCARKSSETGHSDRVRTLEGRCVKLEQDYRTAVQSRDKAQRDLKEEANRLQSEVAEKEALVKERDQLRKLAREREQLVKQLSKCTSERDDLRQQLAQRLAERDTVLGRYERLRKGLQGLVSQDDTPPPVLTPGSPISMPGTGPAVGNPS
jgi:hypothetical protein